MITARRDPRDDAVIPHVFILLLPISRELVVVPRKPIVTVTPPNTALEVTDSAAIRGGLSEGIALLCGVSLIHGLSS